MSEPALPIDPSGPIEAHGDLSHTPPYTVLSFCERVRFTGTLAFESPLGRGALPVLAGVPEIPTDPSDLSRALDLFASLTEGTYTLAELLPPLEGSRSEGPLGLSGSLDRVRVGELLRYAEETGLTGAVTLTRGSEACRVRFTRGELSSMTLDGVADGDLYGVFKWREGTFVLRARPAFTGERISLEKQPASLKTLEVALVDIFEKAGKKPVDSDKWEEKPSGAGFPRARKASLIGGSGTRAATLPFGLEAIRDGVVLPPAKRTVPPPPMAPTPESTVKVFVLEPGTLAKLFDTPSGPGGAQLTAPTAQSAAGARRREAAPMSTTSKVITGLFVLVILLCGLWIVVSMMGLAR